MDSCPYIVRSPEVTNSTEEEIDVAGEDKSTKPKAEKQSEPMLEAQEGSFGTWMLVTRKKKAMGQQRKEGAHFSPLISIRESSPTRSPGFLLKSPYRQENDRVTCDKIVGQSITEGFLSPSALFIDHTHSLSFMEMTCDEQKKVSGSIETKNQKPKTHNAKPRATKKSNVMDKGNTTQKWKVTKGKGVGTAREFGMDLGEFRVFSVRGLSSTMGELSKGKPTQLVEDGIVRMEEERPPLAEILNVPVLSNSCNTTTGISSNFASAKLLKIWDYPIMVQEDALTVDSPKLQEHQSSENEMMGVDCDARDFMLNDPSGFSDQVAHCDAEIRVDDVYNVDHHERGADEMHVEGDRSVLLSS